MPKGAARCRRHRRAIFLTHIARRDVTADCSGWCCPRGDPRFVNQNPCMSDKEGWLALEHAFQSRRTVIWGIAAREHSRNSPGMNCLEAFRTGSELYDAH